MQYIQKAMAKIRAKDAALAAKIEKQGGFLKDTDIPALIAVDRNQLVLVRCNGGRFLCCADNVAHFIGIIEEHATLKEEKTGQPMQGDWIRDVSLPVDSD
jgi:hypothetical protein